MVFYSVEQKIALVEQYILLPHGSRRAWLAERGISGNMMTRWRHAFLLGDIATGARPRTVDREQVKQAELRVQERIMGREIEEYQVLLKHKDERIAQLESELARERQAVEVMGKAIALVEKLSGHDARVKEQSLEE